MFSGLHSFALDVLNTLTGLATEIINFLVTETDGGILGYIRPLELIGGTLVIAFILTRILLAINS